MVNTEDCSTSTESELEVIDNEVSDCSAEFITELAPVVSSHPVIQRPTAPRPSIHSDPYIINVEGSSFPNVSINRNSDKSKGNRDMTHSNNYVHTPSMKKCFHSRGHRIIIGPENVGKTSWCKFILGFKCIVAETFNDIRKFDHKRHNGIIFENLDFQDTHYMLIESLVCYEDRIFRFKDVEVLIPATTRLIFTSRKDDGMIFGTQKCSRKYYKECFRLRLKNNTYREEESDSESPITFEED